MRKAWYFSLGTNYFSVEETSNLLFLLHFERIFKTALKEASGIRKAVLINFISNL